MNAISSIQGKVVGSNVLRRYGSNIYCWTIAMGSVRHVMLRQRFMLWWVRNRYQ